MVFNMPRAAKSAPTALAAHLRPEGIAFLRNLARHNDREWFTPRKAVFEAELKEPMLAIIRKVTAAMESFAPAYVRPAEKCLFRIYRDTRFSADKKPYKTHVAAWWCCAGNGEDQRRGLLLPHRRQGSGHRRRSLYAGEGPAGRDSPLAPGPPPGISKILRATALRKTFAEFEGNALTRPPKGFPKDHPALDLIQCRQWGLSTTLPATAALEAGFAAVLTRHFRLAAPVVDALNTPIAAALAPRKKVLFGLD